MNYFINNIEFRYRGMASFTITILVSFMLVDSAHAQDGEHSERPANRVAWQPPAGQPREFPPPGTGEKKAGRRSKMRGLRDQMHRPPREGFDSPAGRPGPRSRGWQEQPKAKRAEITNFLKMHFPRMSIELRKLKEKNPKAFARRMRRVAPDVLRVMELMKVNPQRATLHIQERKLDMKMRHIASIFKKSQDNSQQVKLRQELSDLASQAFDLQLQLRQMEISDLQARVSELAATLKETHELRQQLIHQRVDMLLSAAPHRPPRGEMAQPRMPG